MTCLDCAGISKCRSISLWDLSVQETGLSAASGCRPHSGPVSTNSQSPSLFIKGPFCATFCSQVVLVVWCSTVTAGLFLYTPPRLPVLTRACAPCVTKVDLNSLSRTTARPGLGLGCWLARCDRTPKTDSLRWGEFSLGSRFQVCPIRGA